MSLIPSDLGFPADKFPSYRPGQIECAIDIAASDKRFHALSAPVGAGKSLIYASAGQLIPGDDTEGARNGRSPRVLVLVGTKGLQAQILDDFKSIGMVDVRGAKNYPCASKKRSDIDRRKSQSARTEVGHGCIYQDPKDCHYRRALQEARESRVVESNYAWWLAMGRYSDPGVIGEFDLLVLDEVHTGPDWLSDFCAIEIHRGEMEGLRVDMPPEEGWAEWAGEVAEVAREVYVATKDPNDKQELARLGQDLVQLSKVEDESIWVRQTSLGSVRFTPVSVAQYAETYLYRGVPKVVLCSATITESTLRRLGVGATDRQWHEMDSGFDARRCPFYYVRRALPTRVDHRMGDAEVRLLVNSFDQVIGPRAELGWKGIIQCRSYQWGRRIVEQSKYREIMLDHTSRDARQVIQKYRDSDGPRVLVSPVVEEGWDFPYDLCRFQIIVKIPFIDSRDPVTKARSQEDKGFLNDQAAQALMQQSGRGMRAADDWCEIFLFDTHFDWFQGKAKFARWFRRTWRTVNSIPEPLDVERLPRQVRIGGR